MPSACRVPSAPEPLHKNLDSALMTRSVAEQVEIPTGHDPHLALITSNALACGDPNASYYGALNFAIL